MPPEDIQNCAHCGRETRYISFCQDCKVHYCMKQECGWPHRTHTVTRMVTKAIAEEEPLRPPQPEPKRKITLVEIPRIGPTRSTKLEEAGISDVEGFSETDEITLKEILGLGDAEIRRMKDAAHRLLEEATQEEE